MKNLKKIGENISREFSMFLFFHCFPKQKYKKMNKKGNKKHEQRKV